MRPLICWTSALSLWPGFSVANVDAGVLYVLALAGFGAYGIILAGWAANSKYAFLGAMRNDRGNGPMTISNNIVFQSDVIIHVQAIGGTGASAGASCGGAAGGEAACAARRTTTAMTGAHMAGPRK